LSSVRLIHGLGDVAADYDILLCDIWGVIHDGVTADQTACAALAKWTAKRGPVVLISNSPRPSPEVIAQLDDLNVPRAAWSDIITSGDATRALLAARAPGPAFRIGPDRDAPLYVGLGLEFSSFDDADFIACTGPNDDDVETPEDYRDLLTRAARRDLVMICANPDIVVQRGDRLIYCGGALAQLYVTLGGDVTMAGKPHDPIYELALARARALGGGSLAMDRVLAIGDGLVTDIAGANRAGLDVLFIAKGVHAGPGLLESGRLNVEAVTRLLADQALHADFALASLSW
jgi:HAD superfamily hydrolase (TIGR01459 family)